MEFDVRRGVIQLTLRLGHTVHGDAVVGQRVGHANTVSVGQTVQAGGIERTRDGAGAEQTVAEARSFLIGPVYQPHGDGRRPFSD